MLPQYPDQMARMERAYIKIFRNEPPCRVDETPQQRMSRLTRAIFTGVMLMEERRLPVSKYWPPRSF